MQVYPLAGLVDDRRGGEEHDLAGGGGARVDVGYGRGVQGWRARVRLRADGVRGGGHGAAGETHAVVDWWWDA